MLVSIFALFILFYLAKNISIKIKEIKTENEDENQTNFLSPGNYERQINSNYAIF